MIVKKITYFKGKGVFEMSRFTLPRDIYHGKGCLEELKNLKGKKAILVVGGGSMKRQGFLDRAENYLKEAGMEVKLFEGVEPDPSVETVMKGAAVMQEFQPDWIVAMGGGSPIDAAKAMWAFYEYPDTTFEDLITPFNFPKLRTKAHFCAIPSTSGTATEVTAFSVITDYAKGIKYPLDSQALRPPVAILDPELTVSAPASVTADAGMDVLTHALEAYVSKGANDFSDALCEKAVSLVFRFLPLAFQDGTNLLAREKMHNASCMAGLAFNSAGLGLNHGMAHAIGAKLHIAHGRINAMLLPHIITFNADLGRIRNGEYALAAKKYQRMAKVLDLPAPSVRLGVTNLLREVERLNRTLKIPASLKEWGAEPSKVKELRGEIVSAALADATTATNPRPAAAEHVEALLNKVMGG